MEKQETSAHETVREMLAVISEASLSSVFDRKAPQEPHCKFGERGICCQLCSNGPCRIMPRAPRGVCGVDADAMAMRNMLLRNCMGTATYVYHAIEAAETLKATGEGRTPFEVLDEGKLGLLARSLGVEWKGPSETSVEVASRILSEMSRPQHKPSLMVEAFAPSRRKEVWQETGLWPGGVLNEIVFSLASCLTNVDGDYASLAKKALRLGVACNYGALVPLEICQDILFGTPRPHKAEVDLGIIDPECVNIVVNGHEPFVGAALIRLASRPEVQEEARKVGAKGLKVVGSIETGQELIQRFPTDGIFVGLTGNWPFEEPLLATGAVDVFAADMNCTLPTLGEYAKKFGAKVVPVNDLVRVPGCERAVVYRPERAEEVARKLISMAVENFGRRRRRAAHVPARKLTVTVGFSGEAILEALGGSFDPLVEAMKAGKVKGVVALVSCSTLKGHGQDVLTLAVARELIRRDLLVLSMGCGNAALQVGGLTRMEAADLAGPGLREACESLGIPPVLSFGTCTDVGRCSLLVGALADRLEVDTSDLPVAVTAPEYMEQKATIDAIFAVAFGLYTHVAPTPPVSGGDRLVKLLTEEVESLTGGKLALGEEPREIVDGIEQHILTKRERLGL